MSDKDNLSDDLDSLLAEIQNVKPPLVETLGSMSDDHFMTVAQAVNAEYVKRADSKIDVGSLNDREFRDLCNRYLK